MLLELAVELVRKIAFETTLGPQDVLSLALAHPALHATLLEHDVDVDHHRALAGVAYCAAKGWWRSVWMAVRGGGEELDNEFVLDTLDVAHAQAVELATYEAMYEREGMGMGYAVDALVKTLDLRSGEDGIPKRMVQPSWFIRLRELVDMCGARNALATLLKLPWEESVAGFGKKKKLRVALAGVAVAAGDVDALDRFVDEGLEGLSLDAFKQMAWLAIELNKADLLGQILDRFAHLDCDEMAVKLAEKAAEEGCREALQVLMDRFPHTATPMLLACALRGPMNTIAPGGHLDLFDFLSSDPSGPLLDTFATHEMHATHKHSGLSLLHVAARTRQVDVLDHILTTCLLDVNATDDAGRTPLHWAARSGDVQVVERLLAEPGIEPDLPTLAGLTPLVSACSSGSVATVRSLLNREDVDPYRVSGTALVRAAICSGEERIVELILSAVRIEVVGVGKDGLGFVDLAQCYGLGRECVAVIERAVAAAIQ